MLQILSGKFFGDGRINEQQFDSVLYSNFSWIQPVTTAVGELRPADARGMSISSYVLRYTMRYEQAPHDILVMPSGDEAAEQFRTLACLWFKAFFHADRYHVEMLCRQEPRHASDGGVPSRFVDTFFDHRSMKSVPEIEGFINFIDKAIGMPRNAYRLLIACASAFLDALEAIDTNRDLAYSMFVYSLEALTQASDGFSPTWNDFPQDTRLRLDKQFAEMQANHVDEIKAALLNNPHLKLKKRFIGFIGSLIEESLFIEEAQGRSALPKNELERALANLYDTRSGYVHSLQPIQHNLRLPNWGAKSDYFTWDHEPYLTFSGLARLVRHVLIRFVERQPMLQKEDYPGWRSELPGIVEGRLAPKYWVARTDNLRKEQAISRFNGFISHLASHVQQVPLELPDMRPLMERIETMVSQSSPSDRRVWLSLYCLVNCIVREADRRPKWQIFLTKHEADTECCAIEMLACRAVLLNGFPWPVEECEQEFERYLKGKHRTRAINLPRRIEIAIMSEIANMHLIGKSTEKFRDWTDRAVLDAAGSIDIQRYLQECRRKCEQVSLVTVLGIPEAALRIGTHACDSENDDARRMWVSDNAYFRWLDEECKHGNDVRHWLEAEAAFDEVPKEAGNQQ
jgi:hypothetical protein